MIFACTWLAPQRGGRHQLPPAFPRLPGIIPVALSAGFSCRRTATVLSRNVIKLRPLVSKVTGLFLSIYSPAEAVNNLCLKSCPELFTIDTVIGQDLRDGTEGVPPA